MTSTCREFLGIARGWCGKEAPIVDPVTYWTYCGRHASERGL